MRRFLGIALVLMLVAAPASARTDGWKPHSVKAAGFSVSAPETWIDVTRLSPQILDKAKQIPSLTAFAELAKRSKAVKLVLVDAGTTTVKNHYASNLNVVVVPSSADLQLLRDASVAQLESSGVVAGHVAASYVNLPAGRAAKLQYRARYGPTSPVVSLVQYLFTRSGTSFVVTYTTLPKLQATYSGAFARSAASFRFL